MPTLRLPTRRAARSSLTRCALPRRGRTPPCDRRGIASRSPPRTSSPIRCARSDPWLDSAIDWDATLAFRRHLWSLGFGVAEAMDTAQRGMGLDWPTSLELIRRSVAEARGIPGAVIVSGAGTDHLTPRPGVDARRRHRRVRGTMRRGRSRRRPHHPDGEPRAGGVRANRPTTTQRLRPRAGAGAGAGDPALAGRDVRPGARRLLDRRRRPCERSRARARNRRLRSASSRANAAKIDGIKVSLLDEGEGDRNAPAPARRACACTRATTSISRS